MSATRYPTDIINFDGAWERIHQGHGLDPEMVAADFRSAHGLVDDAPVSIREVHFVEMPRVKWCGRHADPCDSEGDWHRHWYEVKPSADPLTHYTIAAEAGDPSMTAGTLGAVTATLPTVEQRGGVA